MVWSSVLLLLLVGATFANNQNAWDEGKQYTYNVRSRTLAAFHQQSKQFTGILIKAKLTVQPNGPNTLRAKILQPRYSQIHTRLENGWESEIPRELMNMQNLPLSEKPFEIKTKNGIILDLIVSKDVPTWEVNMLKSVVSQLNIDTQGENALHSEHNQLPEGSQPYALYKTMEDSVTGKCEVVYDISPLPKQMLQSKPELAPLPELRKNSDLINIMKTKNYTNCNQRVSYHFGIDRRNNWEPGSNDNSKYLSRSTLSRVVISGNLRKYTIQSSVTINKVTHSADLYENEQGIVASKMNLTLYEVKEISERISAPSNPESTGNLIYSYNNPFGKPNSRRPNQPNQLWNSKHEHQNPRMNQDKRHHGQNFDESLDDSNESVYDNEEQTYLEPKPKLTEPPKNPMSVFFIGNQGNSVQQNNKIDVVKTTKDMAQEIGNEIQQSDNMFNEETLEKYTILTRLIRTMNAEQIAQVQRELYEPKQELSSQLNTNNQDQTTRRIAWVAFRDAVAKAGTGPALINVKQWIQNKQISGNEAAEIVDAVAQSARIPTPEYVEAFFELLKLPQSEEQRRLHDTSVIAFADLIRHATVDKRSEHNRYPVHVFGRLFTKKNHNDVHEKYIPYIADKLRKAVDNGDSEKIQLYSVALGRVADPRILSVLEPYLEGQRQVSPYQRYIMVLSLNGLAVSYPKVARSVLYKIYSNNADNYEIRVAAVYLLMLTNPPASMLQRMAEYTNYDSNKHVNSAVKSTIQSLALQEGSENRDLFNAARAAQPLLTSEIFGEQFSRSVYYRLNDPVTQSGLSVEANYIGSDDSILPKGVYANVSPTYKGLKLSSFEAGATVSSIRNLLNFVQTHILKQNQKEKADIRKDQEKKYSPEQISKLLDIHGDAPNQIEGLLFGNSKIGNYLLSFDNHTIDKIPEELKYLYSQLRNGKSYESTRLNNYEVTISFPTETGFPFQFNLRTPSVAHIEGYSKLTNEELDNESFSPKLVTLNGKLKLLFGMEVQKRLGFVTPFEHQEYIVGVDRNMQIHVPIRGEVHFDKQKCETRVTIQPNEDIPEFKFLQYKTQPFTSKHDILNMEPVKKDQNTHIIHKDRTTQSQMLFSDMNNKEAVKFNWERQTWNSQEENQRRENKQHNDRVAIHKLSQSLMEMSYGKQQSDAEYEKYSVKLSPSTDMKVEMKLSYDHLITENNNEIEDYESWVPEAKAPRLDKSLNDAERKQKLMREAAKDINSAKAGALNLNLKISGGLQASLDVTAAGAFSNNDPKSRAMLYALVTKGNHEYYLSIGMEGKVPNVKSMDYEQTLKNNKPKEFKAVLYLGQLNDGNGASVMKLKIQGKAKQTEERKSAIRQSRDAQECKKEENQSGNKLGNSCQEANKRAQYVNFGELTLKLEDNDKLSEAILNSLTDAEQYLGYAVDVDIQRKLDLKSSKNEIKMYLEISPNDEMANLAITTHRGKLEINNIKIMQSYNKNNGNVKDTRNKKDPDTDLYMRAVCSLDKSEVKTFDNKRYSLRLGQCWHVALTTFPMNNADIPNNQLEIPEKMHVTVLTKEDENGMKKLKVTLGDKEIQLLATSPRQIRAEINGKLIELSHKKTYQGKQIDKITFELFKLEDGTAKIISDKYDIKILFDGTHAQIKAGEKYRKSVRGLCGNNDGEPENDLKTPKGCTLQRPEEFAAIYALTQDGTCQGPALKNAQKAEDSECTYEKVRAGNIISEQEAGREHSFKSRKSNEENENGHCTRHRTLVTKTDNQICFSLRPVPKCSPGCSAEGERNVNIYFHCVRRTGTSERVAERIEKGANPDLSQKTASKTEKHRIPLFCKA
ncbi:vitellogenin-like [Phymastichus coffea]|uniref:vitellogenin-like n=1 Tax=Phymastichus coffea TaxID=108790 RepID=UPI00273AB810|nr:vitellogenin-like [Phymastichus coffea]